MAPSHKLQGNSLVTTLGRPTPPARFFWLLYDYTPDFWFQKLSPFAAIYTILEPLVFLYLLLQPPFKKRGNRKSAEKVREQVPACHTFILENVLSGHRSYVWQPGAKDSLSFPGEQFQYASFLHCDRSHLMLPSKINNKGFEKKLF
jgi:hypothetical protein